MEAPTCEDLLNEIDGLVEVHSVDDASWRHGYYREAVYHREEDDTYWMANYRASTDGEYNGLREGEARVAQCWPVQKIITVYLKTKPET